MIEGVKKTLLTLALLLFPLSVLGQTGALQGTSTLGGISATTQGAQSSNKLQGVIPAAKISVYLTGTQTLATLTSDGTHSLSNPFYSNASSAVNPGGFIAFVPTNTGYDVVASSGQGTPNCTTGPLCYTQPVTLCKDCFASSQFVAPGVVSITGAHGPITCTGGSCDITGQSAVLQHNGTNLPDQALLDFLDAAPSLPAGYTPVTFSNDGAGGLGGYVPPTNISAGFETQIVPPITGQYVFVPATSHSITQNSGSVTATNISASMYLGTGSSFEIDDTVVWSTFTLPSYVIAANVTAVYAVAVSSQTNYFLYNSILNGPGQGMTPALSCDGQGLTGAGTSGWPNQQVTTLTPLTGTTIVGSTCTAHIGANYSGGGNMIVPKVGYLVYYTGSAPPTDNNVIVAPPLTLNADSHTLALSIPFDVAVDTGSVNAYSISLPWASFQPGIMVRMLVAHQSTSTTPTLVFNGNAPQTIVGPTGLALVSGDLKIAFPANLQWNGTNWVLLNPHVSAGAGSLSGMTAGQVPIAATATTVTSSKALAGSGAGITTGPTSSTNLDCAQFSGTTGQVADAGVPCGSASTHNVIAGSASFTDVSGTVANVAISGVITGVTRTSTGLFTVAFPSAPSVYVYTCICGNTGVNFVGCGSQDSPTLAAGATSAQISCSNTTNAATDVKVVYFTLVAQ